MSLFREGLAVRKTTWRGIYSVIALAVLALNLFPSFPVFASQVSGDTLAGYWKLDESASPSVDASGGGASGTWNGNLSGSSTVPTFDYSNPRSASFDGTGDYISLGSSITFAANAPKSVSLWFKTSTTAFMTLLHQHSNDIYLVIDSNGHVDSWMNNDEKDFGGSVLDDAWHNLIWVHNGTTETAYLDGVQLGTSNTETGPAGTGNIFIGATTSSNGEFTGLIDDVRIYRRALSSTDIADLSAGRHTSATWDGSAGTGFENGNNWSTDVVPDPYTHLTIPVTTNRLTLTGSVQFASLIINTGALMNLNGTGMTMNDSGAFTNYGTLALKNSETVTNITNSTDKGTIMITGTGATSGLKMGNSFYNLILNDGLVGYWQLDETSGTRAADTSGYGNSGALVNAPTISSTVAPVNFSNTRSVSFDGSNDYILASQASLPTGSRPRTLSAWIRTSADTVSIKVPVAYGNCSAGQSFGFYLTGGEVLHFWGCSSGDINTGRTLAVGTWYHILSTYDGTNVDVYLNGERVTRTAKSLNTTTGGFFIGNDGTLDAANYAFPGNVDDVRVYNRVLLPGEIAALAVGNQPSLRRGTVTLNAALDTNGDLILNGGMLDVSSSNYGVTIGGSLLNNGGVLNPRKGTVTFDGMLSSLKILSGGQRFNAVTLNGAGATWTLQDRLTASGALTLTNGTLDANSTGNYSLRSGTITQSSGTFTPRSGILVLTSSSNQTFTPSAALNALHIEDPNERGLVGYWKFDEGTGTGSILDSSRLRATGVRHGSGALVWTGAVLPILQFENPFAMQFNGFCDHVDLPSSFYSQWNNLDAGSIAMWVRVNAFSGDSNHNFSDMLFVKQHDGVRTETALGINASSNKFRWHVGGMTADSGDLVSGTTLSAGTWYHVVGTFDGSTHKLYVNGVLDASQNSSEVMVDDSSPDYIRIGGNWSGDTPIVFFNGLIDDLRLYNHALTNAEARNLYNGIYADGDSQTATVMLGGNLDLSTVSIVSGVVAAGSHTIDVSDDWNNYAGTGAFVASTSTVDFDGSSTQNVRGSTNFSTFEISTASAQTVNFGSGTIQGISTNLILQGASSNVLTLAPLSAGYVWYLDLDSAATQTINYVSPSYSDASSGLELLAYDGTSVDGGNNVNWAFSSSSSSSSAVAEPSNSGGGGGGGHRGTTGPGGLASAERVQKARLTILERFNGQIQTIVQEKSPQSAQPVIAENPAELHGASEPEEPARDIRRIAQTRGRLLVDVEEQQVLYKDVLVTEWYAPYVVSLIENGVAYGYRDEEGKPKGEFGVANSVTRAEILKMALDSVGATYGAKSVRNSSARGTWAAPYVAKAEEMGLTVFGVDTDVNVPATRAEVMQILVEVMGLPTGKKTATFKDVLEDHPYSQAIAVMQFYEVISGDTDASGAALNTFRPNSEMNRAEVAKIIALLREILK